MLDFNDGFGAYIFHEDEINRAAEALANAYLNGYDISDACVVTNICFNNGLNPSNFSKDDIKRINEEIERRLN